MYRYSQTKFHHTWNSNFVVGVDLEQWFLNFYADP